IRNPLLSPAELRAHLLGNQCKKVGEMNGLSIRGSYVETVNCCRRLPNDALTRWFHRGRSKDGETGRFARLRIPKSSISKRSSPFPPIADLREKNAIFQLSEPRRRPIWSGGLEQVRVV